MTTSRWMILGLCAATAACSTATASRAPVAASAGCEQLGDTAKAAASFYEPGNVYGAREVQERTFRARAIQPKRTVGAEMYLHARPGMTREYLQRSLSCHAAHGRAAQPNDPLHPSQGAVEEVRVRSAGSSFAVRVRGSTPEAGREIYQRARSFAAPASSVTVEQVASGPTPQSSF